MFINIYNTLIRLLYPVAIKDTSKNARKTAKKT